MRARWTKTKTREGAATELSRLEHEKARLERERQMWLSNQTRAQQRLQVVERRIAEMGAILTGSAGEPARRRNTPAAARQATVEKTGRREVTLEY